MNKKNGLYSVLDVLDHSSIYCILIISILISLLSLVVPIAAQTLINLLAFGRLLQPVIFLSIMVFVLMAGTGALSIWQTVIIEIIQQKLVVRVSLNLAKHFTHLSPMIFSTHNGPELVNRYFEIVVINKALASLLLYGITVSLQMIFGLILLIFYHPIFLLFDAFLLISLLLIIFMPYRIALESAKQECTQKHIIGSWLEEILINRYLFKYNEYPRYVIEQTDKRLVGFLKARNQHFRQLIKHQIGLYALAALSSSLLLGLGGYLIIHDQLSLGQLVASEIVLGTLIYGFKRLGALLENYYDLMASVGKLDVTLQLPLEHTHYQDQSPHLLPSMQCIHLRFDDIACDASPENPLLLVFKHDNACKQFIESLSGLKETLSVAITLNGVPCTQQSLIALRKHSLLIKEPQWFTGTIYQNLVLNHRGISIDVVFQLLKKMNLLEKIITCPEGIDTLVQDWQVLFTLSESIRLMILRAIIAKPRLLIIDRSLDDLAIEEIHHLMPLLFSLTHTTLLVTTLREGDIQPLFKHQVVVL